MIANILQKFNLSPEGRKLYEHDCNSLRQIEDFTMSESEDDLAIPSMNLLKALGVIERRLNSWDFIKELTTTNTDEVFSKIQEKIFNKNLDYYLLNFINMPDFTSVNTLTEILFMKKYTCFALLAFFGAAALTPVMAATGAPAAPVAPVEGTTPAAPRDSKKGHEGHDHKDHHGHKDHAKK